MSNKILSDKVQSNKKRRAAIETRKKNGDKKMFRNFEEIKHLKLFIPGIELGVRLGFTSVMTSLRNFFFF
jgi:hypothetical protein